MCDVSATLIHRSVIDSIDVLLYDHASVKYNAFFIDFSSSFWFRQFFSPFQFARNNLRCFVAKIHSLRFSSAAVRSGSLEPLMVDAYFFSPALIIPYSELCKSRFRVSLWARTISADFFVSFGSSPSIIIFSDVQWPPHICILSRRRQFRGRILSAGFFAGRLEIGRFVLITLSKQQIKLPDPLGENIQSWVHSSMIIVIYETKTLPTKRVRFCAFSRCQRSRTRINRFNNYALLKHYHHRHFGSGTATHIQLAPRCFAMLRCSQCLWVMHA